MEFSQYVIDAILSIDYVAKNHDTRMMSLLREATENAPSEKEKHILDVIAGASSMNYDIDECTFQPLLIWHDGRRSFAIEDLQEGDLEILCNAIEITGSSYLRTKLAHIVWFLNKDNRYGERAVLGYLDGFQKNFDPENWVGCYEQICLAYHIAFIMGKKLESIKAVRTAIDNKLDEMNGNDPLFLSLNLIELIIKDAPKEKLPKYDSILNIIADRNLDAANSNTTLADATFTVMEKLYNRMNKRGELNIVKGRYACYYETQARALAEKNSHGRAVIMLKTACHLYDDIDKEKNIELRMLLREWCKW